MDDLPAELADDIESVDPVWLAEMLERHRRGDGRPAEESAPGDWLHRVGRDYRKHYAH